MNELKSLLAFYAITFRRVCLATVQSAGGRGVSWSLHRALRGRLSITLFFLALASIPSLMCTSAVAQTKEPLVCVTCRVAPPTITSVTNSSKNIVIGADGRSLCPVSPDTTITINGNGFGATATGASIYVATAAGGQPVAIGPVTSWDSTTIVWPVRQLPLGTYTLSVITTGGATSKPVQLVIGGQSTCNPGYPATFGIVPSALKAVAGVPFGMQVVVHDPLGNVATQYQGTVTFATSDVLAKVFLARGPAPKLNGLRYSFSAADRGSHTFTVFLGTGGNQTLSVTAPPVYYSQSIVGSSPPVLVDASPTGLRVVEEQWPSGTARAGDSLRFDITAVNRAGPTTSSDTISITNSDGQVTEQLKGGLVSASIFFKTLGPQTVRVSDVTNAGLHGWNGTVNVVPYFKITAPTTAIGTAPVNVSIAATDASGNVLQGYNGTVKVSTSDPTVTISSYPFNPSIDAGRHTFSIVLNTGGGQELIFSDASAPIDPSWIYILVQAPPNPAMMTSISNTPPSQVTGKGIPDFFPIFALGGQSYLPGSIITRPNGRIVELIELRGWLAEIDPHCNGSEDWHYELEVDPAWTDTLGITDLNALYKVGNIIANAFGTYQLAPAYNGYAPAQGKQLFTTPTVHVELAAWSAGVLPTSPPDWVRSTDPTCSGSTWAYDPQYPFRPGQTPSPAALSGQTPLGVGQYVRMYGAIGLDTSHVGSNNFGAWLYGATGLQNKPYNPIADPALVQVEGWWNGCDNISQYFTSCSDITSQYGDEARHSEMHSPDIIAQLPDPGRRETVRAVAVVAENCITPQGVFSPCDSQSLDEDIYPPPNPSFRNPDGSMPQIDCLEYQGSETNATTITSHSFVPVGDHCHLHVSVMSIEDGAPGKFKAIYRVRWHQ